MPTAIPTIFLASLKIDAPLSPDALPADLVPAEPAPAGRPILDIALEGSALVVRAELNGKSVRKALKTLAQHGPAGTFVRLQSNLRPPAAPGEPYRLVDAGLTCTPTAPKPTPPPTDPENPPSVAPAGPAPAPVAPAHGLARPDGISRRTWKNMKHKANCRAREAEAAPAAGVPSTPMAGAVARSTITARVKVALAPDEIGSPTSDLLAGTSQSPAVEGIPAGPENDPTPATATDALRRRYRAVTRELRSSLTADWRASLAQALARVEDAVASDDALERLAAELALSNRLDAVMTIGMRRARSATAQAAQDDASRTIRLRTALASRAASRRPQAAASPVAG